MNGRNWRALIVGFAGAIALFVGLFFLVGADDVLDSLSSAEPSLVAATLAVALLWLGAWALVLRTVLETLDVAIPVVRVFFVYASAVFANNVTPFGQAGGEPVAALLISKVSKARYETGLVGIATVDVLNVVSSLSLILVGVGYYATTAIVGERLQTAVASALGVVVAVGALLFLAWRYQGEIVDRVSEGVADRVARLPVGPSDPDAVAEDLSGRMERFFEHIERMAAQRRRLAVAFGLSLLGWLLQAAALLAAFAAIGHVVPVYVLIFVIPLGNLAGAAPLPGGLGGIEAAFVALLVPTTGLPAATVTAAVLIYRGTIYWLPVLIGGGSMAAFSARTLA
ncbi:lysylphosphatidylglycerol synthase transmembrane domain-containing protein [Halalkalicoccus sp. NIPERK01]|uniref:lysylphosphatidylglycerol synthase transmembrane domain-containing protein n=1 Tax=Halalkalicoccus sp. NIPERK01 TaxID=3053469 RepID=UPI00256EC4AB|nr:lysylphosphatidylglycerol synthase transmembrane domain-containing protein [Halalkalicoccus sp. NIPERK01]MDL5362296.1 lysylphosphatidylglycerol synthase transmembrane domain-containing protein [Halalkalicoccus sp. NIPERK01]